MKKRIKKRRFYLIRPAEALLPAAFLAGELIGPRSLKGWLFAGWFVVRLLALFSAEGVRMAFATQPGMRKVRGSTTLAALLQIMGALLAIGAYALIFHGITPFILAVTAIGLVLNIEHVFCEYLRAEGDGYGAEMCSVLTAVFCFAGVMLDGPGIPEITLILTSVGCLISILLATFTGGFRPGRMNLSVIRHAPRAMLGGLAYPLLITTALYAGKKAFGGISAMGEVRIWTENGLCTGFFMGLGLIGIFRTPFRRSSLESRTMVPVMTAIAVASLAAIICAKVITAVPEKVSAAVMCACGCLTVAALVSLTLWGNFKKAEY